jgi:hypothetical protein
MRFQERSWLAERIGWGLLAIFVGLASLGVFSNGALSAAKAEREGVPLSVDYERFQRKSALTRFAVHMPRQTEDEIWLRFSRSFQDTYEVESVQPQPLRSNAGINGINLFFDASEQGALTVIIWARPRHFGRINLEVARLPSMLQFPVLIYP